MLFNFLKLQPQFDEFNCVFPTQHKLELALYLAIVCLMEIFPPVYEIFHNNFMLWGEAKETGEKNPSRIFGWL